LGPPFRALGIEVLPSPVAILKANSICEGVIDWDNTKRMPRLDDSDV
jgi:hypothetical protein